MMAVSTLIGEVLFKQLLILLPCNELKIADREGGLVLSNQYSPIVAWEN